MVSAEGGQPRQLTFGNGITFFDTADVYGDGLSERLIARLRRERREPFHVATKAGRRLSPHVASGYTAANLGAFVDRKVKRPKRAVDPEQKATRFAHSTMDVQEAQLALGLANVGSVPE